MTEEGMTSGWLCRECGRENQLPAPRCAFCAAARPGAVEVTASPAPARRATTEADEDYPKPSWSLYDPRWPAGTATAIICLCALAVPAYGVGLGLLLVLTPALYRLFRIARERSRYIARERSRYTPPWTEETAARLFVIIAATTGMGFLVVVSSLITFTAVCFPTGLYAAIGLEKQGPAIQVAVWVAGFLAGLALASVLGYGLVRLLFRSRQQYNPRLPPPGSGWQSR